MSRNGYTYEIEDPLADGRSLGALKRAIEGKRGQALLRELVEALDSMEVKCLYPINFFTPNGEFCALGALGARRGTEMDDLCDDFGCDPDLVGATFGIAKSLASEIMRLNDGYPDYKYVDVETCGPVPPGRLHTRERCVYNANHPRERWESMRAWAVAHIKTNPSGEEVE